MDAGEVRNNRPVSRQLNRRRRTEARQSIEAVTTRTDGVRSGPARVVGREVDGAITPAATGGEVEIPVKFSADGGQCARGADGSITHEVKRTRERGVITETDSPVESAGLAGPFFPAATDDIPVTRR